MWFIDHDCSHLASPYRTQVLRARLPISASYASVNHTGYEYVRDHLGYRIELQSASFPPVLQLATSRVTTTTNSDSSSSSGGGVVDGPVSSQGRRGASGAGDTSASRTGSDVERSSRQQLSGGAVATPFVFNASIVNWGFAAPVNTRPVLLVILSLDKTKILWQSNVRHRSPGTLLGH